MGKLPVLKAREVIAALQKLGFEVDHVTGSHYVLRHPDGRRAVVPYRGSLLGRQKKDRLQVKP
ncbi:MAG: type II toxin-antitoxin system HicA family toxin [Thermoanaerobacter sp.]|nr:type II toxin-antitoxin system HicA family toxin [Thermoanaerobacter sp.]